uniref:Axin-1 n=1 Tax=Eptatretus burgeri TaxID=7764 RepID=A0A8C4QP10_EPTBU
MSLSISDKLRTLEQLEVSRPCDDVTVAQRPPVPGREGHIDVWPERRTNDVLGKTHVTKSDRGRTTDTTTAAMKMMAVQSRRIDGHFGYEPEGSCSPTSPFERWNESLPSLLEDQEGTRLFRVFLEQKENADLLDFWFACSGFRKTVEDKRPKLAKIIYRKFIKDGSSTVLCWLGNGTRAAVRDCLSSKRTDPAMFEQAQAEVQVALEQSAYPAFLRMVRSGLQSPRPAFSQDALTLNPYGLAEMLSVLQTVKEDEVLLYNDPAGGRRCPESYLHTASLGIFPGVGQRTGGLRVTERSKKGSRVPVWSYSRAPVSSANDSEQSLSSDATMTDDALSVADSSLDGIPPYRRRNPASSDGAQRDPRCNESETKHVPRTSRLPKDMIVDPTKFASELIARLQDVQKEREAQEALDDKLCKIRDEEEEVEESSTSELHESPAVPCTFPTVPTPPDSVPRIVPSEDDPESILDEHVSRVMKTPGCPSPSAQATTLQPLSPEFRSAATNNSLASIPQHHHRLVYHHHHHHIHHGAGKPRQILESEAAQRVCSGHVISDSCTYQSRSSSVVPDATVQSPTGPAARLAGGSRSGTLGRKTTRTDGPGRPEEGMGDSGGQQTEEGLERSRFWHWVLQGERERVRNSKAASSTSTPKKIPAQPWGSTGNHQLAPARDVPTITGPPIPSCTTGPSPLSQLFEVRRRLQDEERKGIRIATPRARQAQEANPRNKNMFRPTSAQVHQFVPSADSEVLDKEQRLTRFRAGGGHLVAAAVQENSESVVVVYYFCGEPIPYRTSVRGGVLTLGNFKELLTKKGNYRYFFKKASNEFDCGVVYEEVQEDNAVLPIFEEKINGKVERAE